MFVNHMQSLLSCLLFSNTAPSPLMNHHNGVWKALTSQSPLRQSPILLWNSAGAELRPNVMRFHWYRPQGDIKAVRERLSGSRNRWWYALPWSKTEKWELPCRESCISWICGTSGTNNRLCTANWAPTCARTYVIVICSVARRTPLFPFCALPTLWFESGVCSNFSINLAVFADTENILLIFWIFRALAAVCPTYQLLLQSHWIQW